VIFVNILTLTSAKYGKVYFVKFRINYDVRTS